LVYKEIEKLEQTQKNLTAAYTDPEIKMTRAEYLAECNKIQMDLKNAAAKLQEIEAQLSSLPTLEEYEIPERFAEQIKERLTGDDWQSTPINKHRISELLNLKISLSKASIFIMDRVSLMKGRRRKFPILIAVLRHKKRVLRKQPTACTAHCQQVRTRR